MAIDYDDASKTYDTTRNADSDIIDMFDEKVHFSESMCILDFGCGTGNYLSRISNSHKVKCFGVEPSDGMIEKALSKNPRAIIRKGDHANIPFEDEFFDFIFMTDVIHHVPDLDMLFKSLYRTLKRGGKLCIVTESYKQIESRWYNAYFPSLASNEKKRYPDISEILTHAQKNRFSHMEEQTRLTGNKDKVSNHFIKMVEEKNYSMFRMLDANEYDKGLSRLRKDIGKETVSKDHAETLVWLGK